MRKCAIYCLFILIGVIAANAQMINVQGKVQNNVGTPIANAIVTLVRQGLKDTTGPDGAYSFSTNTAVTMPSLPQATQRISLKKGLLELSLTHSSPVKIEIFNAKGVLLEKKSLPNVETGFYRFNCAKNRQGANLLLFHVSIGSHDVTFPFFPLNTDKHTITTSVENPSWSGGNLTKMAAYNVVDTLRVTALGYQPSTMVINFDYYSHSTINLTLNKMDLRMVKSDISRSTLYISNDQFKSLINSNTLFAFDLFKNLKTSGNNLFFSPYCISEAIAMIYGGAKKETSTQIANVLRFTLPDSIVHAGFDSLDRSLAGRAALEGSYTLNNAHSIWTQESLSIQKSYLDLLSAYYNTGLYTVDFVKARDSSATAINNWMSEMTAERIKNLLPQNALNSLTRLVLVNALYFKSRWNDTFSVANTRDSAFFNLDSTKSTVPFMHANMPDEQYYETERYQAVDLMLSGWRTTMVIVMPKPGYFSAVENEFTMDTLADFFSRCSTATLILSMPKFSFETGLYDLGSILTSLGMSDAFKSGVADFSGIDGMKDLYIGSAYHKGFISVNEQGVEAAAAASQVILTGIVPSKIMSIDHPFILLIRDRWTKTILFMGRITKL